MQADRGFSIVPCLSEMFSAFVFEIPNPKNLINLIN